MASVSPPTSPVRPSRRAPQRQRKVVHDSDDDAEPASPDANSEEDFTPAPQRSTRHIVKKDAHDNLATPQTARNPRRRGLKNIATESSDIPLDAAERGLEPKHSAITGRRSIRAGRKSQIAIATESPPPPLPTPNHSATPESMPQSPAPLADITSTVINEQPAVEVPEVLPTVQKIDCERPTFEKPMDIVIRARARALPISNEPSPPKSRIVLTYLILTNFKSYAGRQEVGPFHSSFSSVVGPNGSGKSNVIDSLLFVFGFRASKMRQGKISALIHNSAAFPDLEYCEVEVRFQEVLDQSGGAHEVVPESSLTISRKAFKNNSSRYYINGSESNFTTVTTLLRDRGVDLDHKRFLILQGEVESIAQMKPKAATEHDDGLLEYLEDIIGTSRYKAAIEESAAKQEELNEVCQEKNNRVQHVEKEKKGLEAKKDAALAFIKDENDLAMKQSALYQLYVKECEDNIQITHEAVGQMQEQLQQETERHRGSEEGINALKKQHTAESKQFERLEQTTQVALKQLAKIDKETVKFEEKRKHLNAKVKKLEKTKTASQAAVSEATAFLERLSDDLLRNSNSVAEIEGRLQLEEQELATVREKLTGKTRGFSDEISEKQKSLEPWTEQINNKRSAIAVAQSELAMLQERDVAGAQAVADIQARLGRIKEARKAKLAEMEDCKRQQSSLVTRDRQLQVELEKLAGMAPEARSKLSSARQKADEARASLTNAQTQGNVLTGLMRLKESGRIDGFHGRLGNLGAIDQKYDVAISTACTALDNLVVDSVEVGHSCIEYLRKNGLGRANFILLDRLSQRDLSHVDTPEGIPRLFDLVRSKDAKFLPAFYSVLQNTLVAEDLDQANRVAYGIKRWRVVTLDGQLIDKSGTMSGGGNAKAKGKMSSKVVVEATKQQVDKLDADQEAVERQFKNLQTEQQAIEDSLREVQDELPQLETAMQRCHLEIESLDRDIADALRRQSELSGATQPTASEAGRVQLLQSQISILEKDIEKLLANTSGIESVIASLQEKIMEVGGVHLRGQKAKVDGLREQISTLTEEMSGAEVSAAKTAQQKKKNEKAQVEAEAELNVIDTELQSLDDEVEKQSRDAAGIKRQAEDMQDDLETRREGMAALKADLDLKTAELNETRGIELEMRNKLEENQKVLTENQKRLKYWQDKIGKLTIQSVSDLGEGLPEQSLATYTPDELLDLDKTALKGDIAVLEEKIQDVNIELGVLAEYRRRVEEHAARSNDLIEAVSLRDAAKKQCEELRRLRLEGFMEGFSTISLRLKEMYQMITMGGNAELELVDSLDPFSEGILFSVMPPKKSWKNISNLSGGEKTLSSLALVFALHHYKPTPLYVMDEIDAALDFRNVSIVASYIKERTKNAQFIVISLRNNMFELASRLIGVYKVNHMTKSVTVENRDYISRNA